MAATTMDKYCGSQFWNSSISWYTEDPDLTRCFETTVLIWIPCLFLWVFSSFEVHSILKSKNRDIPWNFLNISKLILIGTLFVLSLSDLSSSTKFASAVYNVDIFTPIIKIMSFALSATLLFFARKCGIRSSGVQFIFYLLLCLCGFFQFRSELRKNRSELNSIEFYFYISYLIYYPLVLVMLLLNCFADREPRHSKYPKQRKPCPEQSSSFLSQMIFFWFDMFAWRGFRKPLVEADLWEMKPEDAAGEVGREFEKNWQKSLEKSQRKSRVRQGRASYNLESARVDIVDDSGKEKTILPALVKTFGLEFFFGVFLKLLQDVFTFVNPMILNLLIDFIQASEPQWKGFMYAFLLFAMATLQTIILSQYTNQMNLVGMRMRSAVIAAIYKKLLKISNKARKEKTSGELVNLMAVDAQNFVELVPIINMVWSAPLQILLGVYFLWNILGPSVLAGVAVMILLIPINGYITKKAQVFQLAQMKNKDDRVKLMNELLGGIKVLKLYAWEKSFEKQVLGIRNKEVKILKKSAYLYSAMFFIWNCAPFLVCLVTFMVFIYSDSSNVLTPQIAVVSLALFNIMRVPMSGLPMLMIFCAEAWVSIQRISKFMNSEELDPNSVTHDSYETSPVIIENGFFAWDADPILKNINLHLEKQSLNAIVGAVGAGKTSLLGALLGEMSKTSGRVNTLGTIAYVPQQAWIQNATLRDNILFGKPFDRNLYDEVIECCALKSDLEMLSGGDQTEIGEKGINVSGGQKQRISLARAVYADADLYFLDDPLSAVDSHVGKHIFDKVIGPKGLLRNKTRLFVTHGVSFLSQTDKVVVLKDGEISEIGSYQELLNGKGAFSEFLLQYMNEKEGGKDEESEDLSSSKKNLSDNKKSSEELSKEPKEDQQDKLIEDEKIETGGVKWSVYVYFFKAMGFYLALAAVTFNILFQVFSIGSNMWLTIWSSDPTVADANGTVDASKRDFYLGVYGFLGVGQASAILFSALALQVGTINAARLLHNKLLSKILQAPCTTFFDVTPIGRILNVFSVDLDTLDSVLSFVFISFLNAIFTVIGTIFVISYTTPIFLSVTIPVGILYYFVQRIYVTVSRQLKRLESVSRSPIYSHFGETISGVQAIRAFQAEGRFIKHSETKVDNNQICHFPSILSNQWLSVRLEMIGNLIILFSAIFAVAQRGDNPGLVALSVLYALNFSQTLNFLVQSSSDVETNVVAVERIKENSKPPQEAPWEIAKKDPSSSWPEIGTVKFKDYSVRYRPGLDLVLKNITLEIRGGEKVGVVGRTGAGKSSLMMALFRIIEASEGELLIDGVNIASIGLHTLRSRITIIPQDAILFSGSLRMNLDPSETYSDDDIWKALEHAHLKSFVKGLTAGLYHEVTESGENLSSGQQQLICLSRALLRKTKILVLDEATAAIDLETDNLVQRTIKNEFGDCTILTIAHRLNTIMDSDKIVVLDHGKVAEFDSPTNLLKKSSTVFYGMCKDAGLV